MVEAIFISCMFVTLSLAFTNIHLEDIKNELKKVKELLEQIGE